MDFEDIFEKRNAHYNHGASHKYNHGNRFNTKPYSGRQDFPIIQLIKNNKTLRIALIAVLIIVIVLIIGIVAILLPLAGSIIDYITQNGVSGVVEVIEDFLNKLWNGNK